MGDQGVEPDQDGDDHQVVGDGHEHRCRELAPGVEQGGEQGDEAVAGQLRDEPAEEEHGFAALGDHIGVVVAHRVEVDDLGGEEEEGHGGGDEYGDGHRHHRRNGLPGLLAPSGGQVVDEHRYERRRQDAADDDVGDDVGRGVGQVVAIGEAGPAQGGGLGDDAGHPADARQGGADGHAQGGAGKPAAAAARRRREAVDLDIRSPDSRGRAGVLSLLLPPKGPPLA